MQPSEKIEVALTHLRNAIKDELRDQLLRDQLTGLPNDEALKEWAIEAIESTNRPSWMAFIEVDFFKQVNDEYGYDDADTLLQKIGEVLRFSASNYFAGKATPYRAHGDEFFLTGYLDGSEANPHDSLTHVCASVGRLRVPVHGKSPMTCTVSIGWLLLPARGAQPHQQEEGEPLDFRSLRGRLELAVSAAKDGGRNRVVAYDPTMSKQNRREGRGDCPQCHTKYSIRVPSSDTHKDSLWCSNCGFQMPRIQALVPPRDVPDA